MDSMRLQAQNLGNVNLDPAGQQWMDSSGSLFEDTLV